MTAAGGSISETVDCGPFAITISRPGDTESLIDDERFEDDEFLPYWAELWPSGLALARYVAQHGLAGVHVLELGCGLGLPSLAAAHVGADVVATDWASEALELLAQNAATNGLDVETTLRSWTDSGTTSVGSFELVLAADVLYEERNAEPVLRLLEAAVLETGQAWIADPGRRHAGRFFELARAAGWTCEEWPADEVPRGGITCLRRHGTLEIG